MQSPWLQPLNRRSVCGWFVALRFIRADAGRSPYGATFPLIFRRFRRSVSYNDLPFGGSLVESAPSPCRMDPVMGNRTMHTRTDSVDSGRQQTFASTPNGGANVPRRRTKASGRSTASRPAGISAGFRLRWRRNYSSALPPSKWYTSWNSTPAARGFISVWCDVFNFR